MQLLYIRRCQIVNQTAFIARPN